LLGGRSPSDPSGLELTEEQQTMRALVRLAANPPLRVGKMQRRTAKALLRPYPLGLRFSGKNMSPIPFWLGGAQNVCLNFSDCDVAVQLHFALFRGGAGYMLKPAEMTALVSGDASSRHSARPSARGSARPLDRGSDRPSNRDRGSTSDRDSARRSGSISARPSARDSTGAPRQSFVTPCEDSAPNAGIDDAYAPRQSFVAPCADQGSVIDPPAETTPIRAKLNSSRESAVIEEDQELNSLTDDENVYWPPPRDLLHCANIHIISLHMLPKRASKSSRQRGEQRPRYDGSRESVHVFHPELSGDSSPPNAKDVSSPWVTLSLHPVGGFSAVSKSLPLPAITENEMVLSQRFDGLNAVIDEEVHCVAAEPHATFLRIGVVDGGREVAFETAVLGRLRGGFRVLQLRGPLGTRIELCCLFVHVSFVGEANLWPTARQLRMRHTLSQMSSRRSGPMRDR